MKNCLFFVEPTGMFDFNFTLQKIILPNIFISAKCNITYYILH